MYAYTQGRRITYPPDISLRKEGTALYLNLYKNLYKASHVTGSSQLLYFEQQSQSQVDLDFSDGPLSDLGKKKFNTYLVIIGLGMTSQLKC